MIHKPGCKFLRQHPADFEFALDNHSANFPRDLENAFVLRYVAMSGREGQQFHPAVLLLEMRDRVCKQCVHGGKHLVVRRNVQRIHAIDEFLMRGVHAGYAQFILGGPFEDHFCRRRVELSLGL